VNGSEIRFDIFYVATFRSLIQEVNFMNESVAKTVVNSWNEWDPLKHIIVGRADGTMIQAPEYAIQRDWLEHGFPLGKYGPLPAEMVEKGNEQLDDFVKILEARGIQVDRPEAIDFSQEIQTPDWKQKSMFGCMPPRDVLLTVGNVIIESPMCYRSRWFEYITYRPFLQKYFKEDPNFKWEAAPKPRLTEKSYNTNFWQEWNALSEENQMERGMRKDWAITEEEPLFDAADIARCGKDLFIQQSKVTNAAGIEWLKRRFPDHRIHSVSFREPIPTHIDVSFVPLRPGLVITNKKRKPLDPELFELFKKNDWELVEGAEPARNGKLPLSFCSQWLANNVLVLDPKTVCVEAEEVEQMELIDKLGFEVIPVPFWEVSPFGGGLHCATADVYREGKCEDYFPHQIEGF